MSPDRKPVITPATGEGAPPRAGDSGKDPMATAAQPTTPTTSTGRPAGARQLTTWIDSDLHKRMSLYKVESGQDLKSQVEEAVRDFLARKGF